MAIKQAGKSLASRHSPLADTLYQLEVLNQHEAILESSAINPARIAMSMLARIGQKR